MADLLAKAKPEIPQQSVESPERETGVEADENAVEQLQETKEPVLESLQEEAPTSAVLPAPLPSTRHVAGRPQTDEVTVRVEKILEEGLGPLYASLPEEAKPLFKKKGEEAAFEISAMVRSLRVEVSKAIRLIRDWLHTIPKANKFFLEQEAKIKTDAIIEYVEARKEDLANQP